MAKHASPEDNSFLISVGQHLGAAVALVALVAAAFWGIGQVTVDDAPSDGPVIANPAEDGGDTDTATDGTAATTDGSSATATTDGQATDTTDSVDSSDATDGADVDPSPEPSAEPSPEPSPEPASEAPSPEPTETVTSGDAMAPSSISVQVLDAVRDDGSAAAKDVEERLKADGYRVVANNPASKTYEVTTVFYSEGYEAQARQIADAYGWSTVEPKPSNLSSSVQVHVVVGRDEA